jgi:polyphosphate kinase
MVSIQTSTSVEDSSRFRTPSSPIKEAKEKLWEVLDICLRDRRQAWMLQTDGTYSRLEPGHATDGPEALGTHATLMDLARHRSE